MPISEEGFKKVVLEAHLQLQTLSDKEIEVAKEYSQKILANTEGVEESLVIAAKAALIAIEQFEENWSDISWLCDYLSGKEDSYEDYVKSQMEAGKVDEADAEQDDSDERW